jgi:FkbM family methyltransferase
VDSGLIYDVGVHIGEDTAFYLAKGFRVVGVEANPQLCDQLASRFPAEIGNGRLTIVNAAVAERPGPVTFFMNPTSIWGTTRRDWADRNVVLLGSGPNEEITVPGVDFRDVVAEHGVPYFLKIDIEGADLLCLESFLGSADIPAYVSIESDKDSWDGLVHEFDVLTKLGYRAFKVVPQHKVLSQVPPQPAREGQYVPYRFEKGASGMFGEESPGRWMSRDQALRRYRAIFARYRAMGDRSPLRRSSITRPLARAISHITGGPWWYDTHARQRA